MRDVGRPKAPRLLSPKLITTPVLFLVVEKYLVFVVGFEVIVELRKVVKWVLSSVRSLSMFWVVCLSV